VHLFNVLNSVIDLRLLVVFAILTCIIRNETSAQSSHQIFEHLTTDHGLSSNKVEAILQGKDGFYWIATQNGLNRFDGTSFKIYRNNSTDSTSISHNYCTALVEGQNGDIWIATYKGVSRYIKSTGTFQRIYLQHPSRNFEITNRIYSLAADQEGNIWIAGNGLWKYDVERDSVFLFKNNKTDLSTIPFYSLITRLVYDPKLNGLWFITGNDLVFYSIQQNEFYYKLHNPKEWKVFDHAESREITIDKINQLWFRDLETQVLGFFESDQNKVTLTNKKISQGVKHITADDKNRIWIFYWLSGAEIFDPESSTTDSQLFSAHHRRSALNPLGTFLFIDQQNNYWIASGEGISIYNESNQYYRLHTLRPNETNQVREDIKINALAQNETGKIYLATNLGLFQYDFNEGLARKVNINSPIKPINTLFADGGKLWLGIHDHLLCMDTKTESITKRIFISPGIFFIRKGYGEDLWIGLWTGGLYRLNLQSGELSSYQKGGNTLRTIKSVNLITGMSDNQNFWVGYNGGLGFSKYSVPDDTWTHYHPHENDLSNSNAGTITVITKNNPSHLWLGTHGSGIFRFDPVTNKYENYEQDRGLNSNYINSIIPDAKGNLWISTADGMNYLNIEKNTIHGLDMGLVFSDNNFAANGLRGLNERLYFFCNNEFVEVQPSSYNPGHDFPTLVISNFKIFDKDVALPAQHSKINLSYSENFFSFEYSIIKTHPSKDVDYAYTLEGFDKDWNINRGQPIASYTNVPHGKYTFKVKATNDQGEWSDVLLSMPIQITPPFWRTFWFMALSVILFASAIYLFYRYRIQQIKKIFAVRSKISRDLHDDIGSSLSSIHFYSSVAEKEVIDNPKKAREFLKQINHNSRQIIENISDIVWANTDKKEKSTLAGRIKNYGYDLLSQNNIDCKYSIDEQAERKLTNPEARRNILLIIKEALNNIAKYSEAEYAEVRLGLNGSYLLLDITDNGKGFELDSEKHGNGLNNMKKRAESLNGSFLIQSVAGKGTSIHCRIPLPNISDR